MKIVHRFRSSLILSLFLITLTGCGDEGGGPSISTSATPTGATASLAWDPVQDPTVSAYRVHYGRQSSGQPGSCAYEDWQEVSSPSATITGLEPNTQYYFSVSSYNGLSSPCSNEVSTVTPPSQVSPQVGADPLDVRSDALPKWADRIHRSRPPHPAAPEADCSDS